jgi:hypothetical protein
LGNTVLWPIALLNERARITLEKNLEKYRAQLNQVPPDKVAEVPPELGVPIAEKLSYVTNDQLSDLYVNLLAKASTFETAHLAHPSFVNVINNISPDEAILLLELKDNIPFIEARIEKKDANEWIVLAFLTGLENKTKLSFPNNIPAYLSYFEGWGLINIRHDIFIANPKLYEELEKLYRPAFEAVQYDKEKQLLTFARGKIEVTSFGKLFLSACLTKLTQT